ncbi:putative esterase [Rosellinia necatrix]|uniref:Putative esterase n=1 Tax=Rosellinia necatrix TaxID=77044 RepID=A0A1W2TUU0_ROSNE|nr:putative esterase [Rosellinia necatrix]
MASPRDISYLEEPLNPYIADYDLELRGHSESETRHWYDQEKNHIIKRAKWQSQRRRRNMEAPTDEYIRQEYGLLRNTRRIPRAFSRCGFDYQSLVSNKVITEDVNIVVAHKTITQETKLGTLPCIFYIHGGGRYGGTPYSGYLERAKEWTAHFNAITVSVDYRLSPNKSDESPTREEPTNDCLDALTWVYRHLGDCEDSILKYGDRTKIIIFGTSAGGGLAASVTLKWYQERRKGTAEPLGALYGLVLEAPQLDDRCNTQSHEKFNRGNMFSSADALLGWEVSLGAHRGTEDVSIFEAPARASDEDARDFPPTYIEVGTAEPFKDEAHNFCKVLRSARVNVEMNFWDGGFHGFFAAKPDALVSKLCNLTKMKWLCQRLGVDDEAIDNEYKEVRDAYNARSEE